MKPIQKKFTIQLAIIYIISNILLFGIYHFTPVTPVKASYLFIVLFAAVTAISFYLVSKSDINNTRKFNTLFMLSFGIRFFTYLVFALIYLLLFDPDPIHFVVLYFLLYVIFTTLEVIFLIKMVQPHPKV